MKLKHHNRQADTRLMRLRDRLLEDMEEMQAALQTDTHPILSLLRRPILDLLAADPDYRDTARRPHYRRASFDVDILY